MIAVDTNILVYAHRRESPDHLVAKTVLSDLCSGWSPWAIPWPCIHEFLAVVTRPGYFVVPTTRARARDQIDAWIESPSLSKISESDRHWRTLDKLVTEGNVLGLQVHDAKIAAICLDAGVSEFWSADRDFSRFPALRTRNPLVLN